MLAHLKITRKWLNYQKLNFSGRLWQCWFKFSLCGNSWSKQPTGAGSKKLRIHNLTCLYCRWGLSIWAARGIALISKWESKQSKLTLARYNQMRPNTVNLSYLILSYSNQTKANPFLPNDITQSTNTFELNAKTELNCPILYLYLYFEYKFSGLRPGAPSSVCKVGRGGCSWLAFPPQCGIDQGTVINGIDHQCGIGQGIFINVE